MFLEWSRVRNAVCSKVIVIGPYPTCEFIDEIQNTLSPEALYVVVDESWKPAEIRKIQDKVGSDHVVPVRTKNGIGIVHAKMYFVEYSKLEKTFSRVFFGSVNASNNSIANNSEFINSFKLSSFLPKNQTKIRKYFDQLIQRKNVNSMDVTEKMGNGMICLSFPEVSIASKIKSFYNWLRSGYFFVKYEPDSTFGIFSLKLDQDKLSKSELERNLEKTFLKSSVSKSEVRWRYFELNESKSSENWKKYTVETDEGLWASAECCASCDIPPTSDSRKSVVDKIKQLNDCDAEKIAKDFCKRVEKIRDENKYLRTCIKRPDWKKIKRKILNDVALANDLTFAKRYMTGYSRVYHLTNNSSKLKRLSLNFIDSCSNKACRQKVENLMALLFRSYFSDLDRQEIHKELLNKWDDYKTAFVNYYCLDPKSLR